jgi:hypothetical protein
MAGEDVELTCGRDSSLWQGHCLPGGTGKTSSAIPWLRIAARKARRDWREMMKMQDQRLKDLFDPVRQRDGIYQSSQKLLDHHRKTKKRARIVITSLVVIIVALVLWMASQQ